MSPYLAPPALDLNPPTAVYFERYDRNAVQDTLLSGEAFNRLFQQWIAEIHIFTGADSMRVAVLDLSPAARLRRVLDRTGWSRRELGAIIGRSHTEVRRILEGRRIPHDNVVRIIADLDFVTEAHARTTRNDQSTIRRMLTAAPFADGETGIDAIRAGNVLRALHLGTRVLYPRVEGMFEIPHREIRDGIYALDEIDEA